MPTKQEPVVFKKGLQDKPKICIHISLQLQLQTGPIPAELAEADAAGTVLMAYVSLPAIANRAITCRWWLLSLLQTHCKVSGFQFWTLKGPRQTGDGTLQGNRQKEGQVGGFPGWQVKKPKRWFPLHQVIPMGPAEEVDMAYSRESTPPASMCRWFRVVIEVVRWRLAWSNCLISRVISLT